MDSPVGFTVHRMPAPDLDDRRRTAVGRIKMVLVLLVCAAPVIASYFTYFVIRPDSRTNYSDLIQPAVAVPSALALVSVPSGQAVPVEGLKGQWILAVVGDAGCNASCENLLFLQRQLRETLGREKDRVDKVWFVTDQAAIRPEVQRAVSTGTPVQALRVARDDLLRWLQPRPGHALEDHIYIIDPRGDWMMRVPAQPDPSRLKRDVDRLLRASSSWDRPGR